MAFCTCYKKDVDSHRIVNCIISKNNYNIDSVAITSAVARQICPDSGITWTCKKCQTFGGDINDLKAVILCVQQEMSALKKTIDTLPQSSHLLLEMERIVQEVGERDKLKNNLVFYGVSESSDSQSADGRRVLGSSLLRDVLSFLGVGGDVLTLSRLGKYDFTRESYSRPIKIGLSSKA